MPKSIFLGNGKRVKQEKEMIKGKRGGVFLCPNRFFLGNRQKEGSTEIPPEWADAFIIKLKFGGGLR
jgi:hypothetical protein